jgi:uncharacterized membrane protein YebE (DUF533 family)
MNNNPLDPRNLPAGLDVQNLLKTLMSNPVAGGAVGGLLGSVLGGALGGKGAKKLAGGALKAGGLALVGTIAWKAWQQYQAQQGAGRGPGVASQAQLPAAFDLEQPTASGSALRVVQAMVAAAKADGVVEPAERQKIMARLEEARLGPTEQQLIGRLLDQPLDLDSVVQGVNSAELAAEVYAASAIAVHPANRVERGYLDMLAARLGMEPALIGEIDRGIVAALEQPPR